MKDFSKILEGQITNILKRDEELIQCLACGEYSPKESMLSTITDGDGAMFLVCPKCYWVFEEKADELEPFEEDPKDTALKEITEENCRELFPINF